MFCQLHLLSGTGPVLIWPLRTLQGGYGQMQAEALSSVAP